MDPKHAHYVAVTGIIVKDGKYLITKRSPNEIAFPNKWAAPGGKIELDDYIKKKKTTDKQWYNVCEDVLRREVMEEAGLLIKNIRYLTNLTFIRADNIPVVVISLFADWAEGEVKLNEEATEYAWVDIEEAKNYDFMEGIYSELVMVDKVLKGNSVEKWSKKF
jgi:8-oxo-dGTP diphosphatase